MEKQLNSTQRRGNVVYKALILCLSVVVIVTQFCKSYTPEFSQAVGNPDGLCPVVEKLDPAEFVYDKDRILQLSKDKEYIKGVVERWSGAIQIPSISNDVMVNPNTTEDLDELYKLEPAWKQFTKLHEFLEKTYPLIHKHLKVEKVNKFALLYTWEGTDKTKEPILLTAHQDVVPVPEETLNQWDFPPFAGIVKDGIMHGRGSADCKDLMLALFEVIELLLLEGKFEPQRTILLGFGYDEESQGTGAVELAKFLLERYGPHSLYALIDEGSTGYETIEDTNLILVATGEKGHLNSQIELFTPGGHSSMPPKHTGIGIISKLVDRIESVDYPRLLTNINPTLNALQCVAEHSSTISKSLKSDILKAQFDAKANANLVDYLSKARETEMLIKTTQATDIISGGIKSNALPEHVSVLINHRIAVEESVASTAEKILEDIKFIAKKFDLGIIFDNKTIIEPTKNGYFNYVLDEPLEPAPVTPLGTEVWNTFGGSLRFLYEDVYGKTDKQFITAPLLMGGNTDTKAYWDLTSNIFRYQPGLPTGDLLDGNIHSIGEYASVDSHLAIISFYYFYLQVVDQAA